MSIHVANSSKDQVCRLKLTRNVPTKTVYSKLRFQPPKNINGQRQLPTISNNYNSKNHLNYQLKNPLSYSTAQNLQEQLGNDNEGDFISEVFVSYFANLTNESNFREFFTGSILIDMTQRRPYSQAIAEMSILINNQIMSP